MKMNSLLHVLLLATLCSFSYCIEFEGLNHIKPKASPSVQRQATIDLIKRVAKDRYVEFNVDIKPDLLPSGKDTFVLQTVGGVMLITATTGVMASMGFHHYLKYYCGCHMSWAGDQVKIPKPLPNIPIPLTISSLDKFRYYENVCTVSYSFAFLNWDSWQGELAWMALHGINLPLAFNGQEAIFQRVYLHLGVTQEELDAHFAGPAFQAWGRMGNLRGWGGPLPQNWIDDQLILQHKILTWMRNIGMVAVLPGFAGHIPKGLTRVYPHLNVSRLGDWGRFPDKYCCTYLLDFGEPLFKQIGEMFIKEQANEFGTDHLYNADTFNELTPASSDPVYLANAGRAVFAGMTAGDIDAVWVMQGWLFLSAFWKPPQVRALVTSVPIGKMLILDLYSELVPQFSRFESYYGQPFIWCMLHNFGGTLELYGALNKINSGPTAGRKFPNSTMIGTGFTPEGINQNDVVYEFMSENTWRNSTRNITTWISEYAKRRYAGSNQYIDKGWQLLKMSVYTGIKGAPHNNHAVPMTHRPQLKQMYYTLWYKPEQLYEAWDNFVLAINPFNISDLYRYDLVDVTRNSLQILSIKYYLDIITAYKNKDPEFLHLAGDRMLGLLADMETLLASNPHFLLGSWVKSATDLAKTKAESILYMYNAKNQVTLWGPDGEILDYAAKQWSGVMGSYYYPRWKLFVETLESSLKLNKTFDQKAYDEAVFKEVEQPFTLSDTMFPSQPIGDSIKIVKQIYQAYRPETRSPILSKLQKWSEEMHRNQNLQWNNEQLDSGLSYKFVQNMVNRFEQNDDV